MSKASKSKGHIIAAWAESASGPGWGNAPIWYIMQETDMTLTRHCLQPDEQSAEMGWLYRVSEAAHRAMTVAVENHLNAPARKRKRNRKR